MAGGVEETWLKTDPSAHHMAQNDEWGFLVGRPPGFLLDPRVGGNSS